MHIFHFAKGQEIVNSRTNIPLVHGQRKPFPCVPNADYIPLACIRAHFGHHRLVLGPPGFALGLPGFALEWPGFLINYVLVSATQISCAGCDRQREAPT